MSDAFVNPIVFFDLMARSTLIVVVAACAIGVFARLGVSAASRHALWVVTLVLIAALPIFAAIAPNVIIALPHGLLPSMAPDLSIPGDHRPPQFWAWLWALYAIGAFVFASRLIAARLALANLWRQARPLDDADARELAVRFHVRAELRVTDAQIAPMTWGRRILLPAQAADWSAERRREVLLHELGHMKRRDSLTQRLAGYLRALFWFSPGVWFALRRLRIEQEHASDAFVLAAGAAPEDYARTLVDVAVGLRAPSLGMGVSAAMAASDLEQRVRAIVTPSGRAFRAHALAACLGAVTLTSLGFLTIARPVDAALILDPLTPSPPSLGPLQPDLPNLARPAWSPGR
jgi:beta-lactamase regulating signal transducer with metallopeptidase domain